MKTLHNVLLVIFILLVITTGCSPTADQRAADATTTRSSSQQALNQDLTQGLTLGEIRLSTAKFLNEKYGIPLCNTQVFRRISPSEIQQIVSQTNFPTVEDKEALLQFLTDNSEHIMGIFGTPETSNETKPILRLLYSPVVAEEIPRTMGCEDGIYFDLSGQGIHFNDSSLVIPPPSLPFFEYCRIESGFVGECCQCNVLWIPVPSRTCPKLNNHCFNIGSCCAFNDNTEESITETCGETYPPEYWNDTTPAFELGIGEQL